MDTLATLTARYAQAGQLDWIGLRPARLVDPVAVTAVDMTEAGLLGDHARPGKRAVTLIQAEHLPVIAALAGLQDLTPATLRRNLVVSRLNLSAWRGKTLRIGDAVLEVTGPCAPCSRMERALGPGGYTAMRGHGGWCARVVTPGTVQLGDQVRPEAT
ncbi:MAG: MOSC domain-containing protein [Pseudomonadota bacterium]